MARINSKGSSKTIFLLSQNRIKQTIVRLCSIEISWIEFDKSSFYCLTSHWAWVTICAVNVGCRITCLEAHIFMKNSLAAYRIETEK